MKARREEYVLLRPSISVLPVLPARYSSAILEEFILESFSHTSIGANQPGRMTIEFLPYALNLLGHGPGPSVPLQGNLGALFFSIYIEQAGMHHADSYSICVEGGALPQPLTSKSQTGRMYVRSSMPLAPRSDSKGRLNKRRR